MALNNFRQLTSSSTKEIQAILSASDLLLADIAEADAEHGDIRLRTVLAAGELGIDGQCGVSSDTVTRAAHALGFMATLEHHDSLGAMDTLKAHDGHVITSFAPFAQEPTESDLILCRTWRQFASGPKRNRYGGVAYFGPRRGIRKQIRWQNYYENYAPNTIVARCIIHRASPLLPLHHQWLSSHFTSEFEPREAQPGEYPSELWRF